MTEIQQPSPLRVVVIVGSARRERLADPVSAWVQARLGLRVDLTVEVVDVATADLPDDALLAPGGGAATPVSAALDRADAYVVVTPEYNHAYPAALKRLIDWHFAEWLHKAAAVVPYGALGGLLAAEQLRGVFAELGVVTTRRVVPIVRPWEVVDGGELPADDARDAALDAMVDELSWWARVLRDGRTRYPQGA